MYFAHLHIEVCDEYQINRPFTFNAFEKILTKSNTYAVIADQFPLRRIGSGLREDSPDNRAARESDVCLN